MRLAAEASCSGALAVVVTVFLVSVAVLDLECTASALPVCRFPAIYNFGDSNSDTGGIAAAFYPMSVPCGETYFHHPVGRASDGRLMIDFIAEHLGLPHLSSYLDSIGTSYRHGANFATGGATITRQNESWFQNGVSPFPLDIQSIAHFDQFKARTSYLYNNARKNKHSYYRKTLPRPEDFSKALYVFDIGQNDLSAGFRNLNYQQIDRLKTSMPSIVDQLAMAVQHLYQQGARTFWMHNTGPIGCLSITLRYVINPGPGYLDKHGCVRDQNEMASEFNRRLKERVTQMRHELPDAALTYVDVYAAKYELITNAEKYGFRNGRNICCGAEWGDKHVWCGQTAKFNGTQMYAGSCTDPSSFISWDGVHYTEAANRWIAMHLINGTYSSVPISHACYRS